MGELTYSTPQTSQLDLMGPTSKGREDRGWEGEGMEKGLGERERVWREGSKGPGRLGRGNKAGKGNGGDKSRAWSSQDLGSTALFFTSKGVRRELPPPNEL